MSATSDVIDAVAGTPAALRTYRDKAHAHTQGAHAALLTGTGGLPRAERAGLAAYAAELDGARALAAHYRDLSPAPAPSARFAALRRHAGLLVLAPSTAGPKDIAALTEAGWEAPEVVAASQLVAFVTYQARLAAGLRALGGLPAEGGELPAYDVASEGRPFTIDALEWDAWVETVDVDRATPEQLAVLEESLPTAKTSPYYLALVHDVTSLRERSRLYNAIMYAPRGLDRRDREIAALAVSRVNGCVYCASVHARRFTQLNKADEGATPARAILDEGPDADTGTARRRAVADFAVRLTREPNQPLDLTALRRDAGLDDTEILDLVHVVAVFAWANRLMLTLGEPRTISEEPHA
ncbi:peroxidase-related enzyme [Streptomyces sp. NBC_01186]|uniref:CMD domain-containing protein n=1 Tax=Streptomyces sp. NBC_01186 TaxID=2903765 RepID=UPI002E12A887|nr:peroxidase-related enzyme [Streptomyces sp. NBC_01186]WSS12726.1 peroxidase-related enzyme [Streptomyces sp. NBC_01186]